MLFYTNISFIYYILYFTKYFYGWF